MDEDPKGWLDRAHEAAAAGRDAEALDLYERYHERSRQDASQFGIRLSYALSRWADLGRRYPPALEALTSARDAAAARLRQTPDREQRSRTEPAAYGTHPAHPAHADFAEVVAISVRLGDERYPAELFAELDRDCPQVAADCWAAARSVLVRTGCFELAARHLGDPGPALARSAAILDQRLSRGFAQYPEHRREQMRQDAVNGYLTDVREMVAILDGTGAHERAEATRRQAVEAVAWAHVRDDVAAALLSPPD